MAAVLLGAAVGAVSEVLAEDPKPTRSMIEVLVGLVPVNADTELTNATFPAVADIAILPVAFGLGSEIPLAPPPC